MQLIGGMSLIIDESPGRKLLKKSLITGIFYQLGYKLGLDGVKLCHDRCWVDRVQDIRNVNLILNVNLFLNVNLNVSPGTLK